MSIPRRFKRPLFKGFACFSYQTKARAGRIVSMERLSDRANIAIITTIIIAIIVMLTTHHHPSTSFKCTHNPPLGLLVIPP
jgi:hypothetical protein